MLESSRMAYATLASNLACAALALACFSDQVPNEMEGQQATHPGHPWFVVNHAGWGERTLMGSGTSRQTYSSESWLQDPPSLSTRKYVTTPWIDRAVGFGVGEVKGVCVRVCVKSGAIDPVWMHAVNAITCLSTHRRPSRRRGTGTRAGGRGGCRWPGSR